jgi:hypothetical protein
MAYKFMSGSSKITGDLSGSGALYYAGAATFSSTLAVTGAVTANAGVVVDNITIDGTEIDLSSGDLTLDVAGDILLDAAGEEVIFKDGSTNVGHVSMDSDNLTIKSLVSDKDMIFQGNDGGSGITALTLDMSAAGAAAFNSTVTATGFTIGSAVIDETDLEKIDGITDGAGAANKALVLNGDADVASGLRSITGSGDIKVANVHVTGKFYGDGSGLSDVAASASGSARVYSAAGVESSGYLKVSGAAEFADIISGSGGLHVDLAATLGSTLAVTGAITANAGVVVDNITIDGTEIDLSSGDLTLDVAGDIILDAAGEEVIFKDGSTNVGHVSMDSDNLTIKSLVSDKDMIFQGNDGGSGITALTLDMSAAGAAAFNSTVTATGFTIGSAVIAETELELLDGVTAGTVIASKVMTVDANIDADGLRSLTGSGDLKIANVHATGVFYGDGSGLTGVGNTSETVNSPIGDENKTLAAGLNFGLHSLSAARNWTLPATPSSGDKVIVKAPTGSDWNASLYYVNLTAAGAQKIDGVSAHRLNSVAASVTLVCISAGVSGVWTII